MSDQPTNTKRPKWIVDSQDLVSEFLQVPRPTIAFWKSKGMPVEDDGTYDLQKILVWVLATDRKIGWNVTLAKRRAFLRAQQ
jgi:hypothetical protein